ncbi:MAG: DNA polymerase III subunit delta [Pseudomonadota bacterium]
MKLSGAGARRFCAAPDLAMRAALLYGPDPGLLALQRQKLTSCLCDDEDLRVTRLDAGALRSDPAELETSLKSRGFFPGRRVVVLEEAKDSLTKLIGDSLSSVDQEDAFLIVTATGLTGRSSLRKLFETGEGLVAAAFYPDAPDGAEVSRMLSSAGVTGAIGPEIEAYLAAIAADLDPGSFHQLIEKISLFLVGRTEPPSIEEIVHLCPATVDPDIDALINAVAEGRPDETGRLLNRVLTASGATSRVLIFLSRHFRQIFALTGAEDGIEAALGRVRPPVFGPRRARLARQAVIWQGRIETAMRLIFETERQLRRSGEKPERALTERCLIRLAMLAAQSR